MKSQPAHQSEQQEVELPADAKCGEIRTLADGRRVEVGIDGDCWFVPDEKDTGRMLDLQPDIAELLGEDIGAPDDLIRLKKGESVRLQLCADSKPMRLCQHALIGETYVACPERTSQELLEQGDQGRKCPLCAAEVPLKIKRFVKAAVVATGGPNWRPEPKPRVKIWALTQAAWNQFDAICRQVQAGTPLLFNLRRNEDEFGTYSVTPSDASPVELRNASPPQLKAVSVWSEKELEKLADTWTKTNGLQPHPEPGRVALWRELLPGVLLVPLIWGTKKPARAGFLDETNVRRWMADPKYLERLDLEHGIAMLNRDRYVHVDIDRDDLVEAFEAKNPWTQNCRWIRGARGRRYLIHIKDESYPHHVIHAFLDGKSVGEFRGAESSTLDNLHPSGVLYDHSNGEIKEITYTDIKWPDGWVVESPRCREQLNKFVKGYVGEVGGGLLDLMLLENVHHSGDRVIARCPACAEAGSDRSGNHLVIYGGGEGAYGCCVNQDEEHYQRIFQLAMKPQLRKKAEAKEEVQRLAAIVDPIEYAQESKKAAEELGVPQKAVDAAVKNIKSEARNAEEKSKLGLTEIEPWPQPVDGAELLKEIHETCARFIVIDGHSLIAIALWILHTYCFKLFEFTPILHIGSPDRGCGKSRVLEVLSSLVLNALGSGNATAAALFRAIEKWTPTFLLDEYDSLDDEVKFAIKNILNTGFKYDGCAMRCDGENNDIKRFSTFCPKAVAGIGELPDTAASRAIRLVLNRKLKDEKLERFRRFDGSSIRRKCLRWAEDNKDAIQSELAKAPVTGYMPESLGDREMDIWEPLFVLANLCGREWPALVRDAALRLCDTPPTNSLQAELLIDIHRVLKRFKDTGQTRIRSKELLEELNLMTDRPWPSLPPSNKPMTEEKMASLLRFFKIKPKSIRFGSGRSAPTAKGYELAIFDEPFKRYLPSNAQEAEPTQQRGDRPDSEDREY